MEESPQEKEWFKVIICGMPMEGKEFVEEDGVEGIELRGFFSYIYIYLVAPIEMMFVNQFVVFIYEGSYWSALKEWLFGDWIE